MRRLSRARSRPHRAPARGRARSCWCWCAACASCGCWCCSASSSSAAPPSGAAPRCPQAARAAHAAVTRPGLRMRAHTFPPRRPHRHDPTTRPRTPRHSLREVGAYFLSLLYVLGVLLTWLACMMLAIAHHESPPSITWLASVKARLEAARVSACACTHACGCACARSSVRPACRWPHRRRKVGVTRPRAPPLPKHPNTQTARRARTSRRRRRCGSTSREAPRAQARE